MATRTIDFMKAYTKAQREYFAARAALGRAEFQRRNIAVQHCLTPNSYGLARATERAASMDRIQTNAYVRMHEAGRAWILACAEGTEA